MRCNNDKREKKLYYKEKIIKYSTI